MRVNQVIAATAAFAAIVLAPVLGATAAHAAAPAVVAAEDTPWGPTAEDTPWGPTSDDTPWGPTGV